MLRIGAVAVGVLILASSYVDVSGILGRLLTVARKTPVTPIPVVPIKDEDAQFLHIIDLWHQLRTECADHGLPKAVVAIDRVFPLLNDRIEQSND